MAEAIYPATFDPITNGHVEIAERAAQLFTRLVVGVYDKPLKNWLFSIEERLAMTRQALSHLANVQVERYGGLTVDFAKERNINYIVRGLRTLSDFEWELQLAQANQGLVPDVETICLLASQKNSFLSSSLLKEIAVNEGKIDHLAPPMVVAALRKKFAG
ncbi:MAG TPA: pantetheine-phosphate adenylyltransferase [Anaerolineae bacterium]|nr:pantetheine-phosphate adenylyltransferase [Anaerolineae bacterium]MCB0177947.1 pantetheine-phosphate adenylyltransferase [Anaerolineae bacterium]MCB9104154.1 pantetheine-phosphate adenylyltransferase [Anaerolineales bacterium]HRV94261.1 pantetheine-phosphate adenylyltransferase [Anaerolineae bacterium]